MEYIILIQYHIWDKNEIDMKVLEEYNEILYLGSN